MLKKINVKIIDDYIKINNLSKAKFCKLCNIGAKTLNKFYNNDLTLTIKPLLKVIKVLNISSCDLIILE